MSENLIINNDSALQIIIDNSDQYIFWKDKNFVFRGCNIKFARLAGFNNINDIIGKTDFDLTDENKAKRYLEMDKKVLREHKGMRNIIEENFLSDGSKVCINMNRIPLYDDKGNSDGILVLFNDISDKIKKETIISEGKEKYKNLIEFTNTGYIIMDTNMKILELNQRFLNILGKMSMEGVIGQSLKCWVHTNDINKLQVAFDQLISHDIPIRDLEVEMVIGSKEKNNEMILVSLIANIIHNGDSRIFCLVRDASQKKLDRDKEIINKQKKKDRLLQKVREIRNELKKML